jgi:hypothetical protein
MSKDTKPTRTSIVKWALGLTFGIIAALGSLFGVDTYIENKVTRLVQDEKVIKKL